MEERLENEIFAYLFPSRKILFEGSGSQSYKLEGLVIIEIDSKAYSHIKWLAEKTNISVVISYAQKIKYNQKSLLSL